MEHDFSHGYWGHAQYLSEVPGKDDEWSGIVISEKSINVGDVIFWKTAYGQFALEVTESVWPGDPQDLYRVKAVAKERRVSKASLAQGEPPWPYVPLEEA